MRKVHVGTAALILLACGLWVGNQGVKRADARDSISSRQGTGSSDGDEVANPLRTKHGAREEAGPRASHAPGQLKEFLLPEVAIDGLTLDEALRKLMGVYEETCKKTGETPLRLTFDVPAGTTKKLHLLLRGRNFSSSVQLLATLSGMTASRKGPAYQFTPIIDGHQQVSRKIRVSPDLSSRLGELAGQSAEANPTPRVSIYEMFRKLDWELDPSTRLALKAGGVLNLETTSAADAAMVSALIEGISAEKPLQHKFTARIIDLAADDDWTPPDTSRMSDTELQLFMRGMAEKQGVTLRTMPSVTSRGGEGATIEISREWIVPVDDSGETFETHKVGQVMQLQASPLGFGHDLAFNFTDTTAKVDPETGKPHFNKHTDVEDAGFSSDNGARFVVQTRPDGSKSIVLVTSSFIDATGRPIHGAE